MQVSPSVRAIQIPDDHLMRPEFTTIYLVGKDQALLIDAGENIDAHRWMLRGYLAAVERTEIATVALSHYHFGHSGNLKWLREHYRADVLLHPEGIPFLKAKDFLPAEGVSTFQEDGQVLDLGGGVRLQVFFTPGHTADSVSFYLEDEGVLFSGDTMLGSSTTVIDDLHAYMRSLERLRDLPHLTVICPAHGPLIHDPRERIQAYIDHRTQRERRILEVLAEGGELTSWDIMLRVYTDLRDTRLRRAADGNVRTHLRKLEKEGRLQVVPGVKKEKSPEEQEREEAEARRQAEVLVQAREAEEQARRAALAAQENPPVDEWEVMPRYRLVGAAPE
ncbi:MAG: MBL fold metallo-hydrolase [Chloroflexi bacterium]|nr:MBL fold metallo-hydrolase [Chloroflexota bacterium]